VSGEVRTLGNALRTRVESWADAHLDFARVELPNEPFPRPTPDQGDALATSWVRVQILGVRSRQITNGPTGKREYRRLLHFEVYTPAGINQMLAEDIAGTIADFFRGTTDGSGSITYEEPDPHESDTQEDPWYRWAVSIPVRFQFHPDTPLLEAVNPVVTITQAAHGFAAGDAVYQSAGTWAKAIATAEATLADGVVVSTPDTSTAHIALGGLAKVPAHGFTPLGATLWMSQGTAGLLTTSEPGSGLKQRVATVIDASTLQLHLDRGEGT
jgi:hypothetical protein